MSQEQDKKGRNMEIDIHERVAQGRYANLAIISHSPSEFIFDFATFLPGMQKPKVSNRIILTPEHAKRLYQSLKDNITKFEQQHGEITTHKATEQHQDPEHTFEIQLAKLGEA